MSGIFALSINPEIYQGNFLQDLFWGTFYHQHLGEEYGGLSTSNGRKIKIRTHRGLFRPNFTNDLVGLKGKEGIGFCGLDREPFLVDSKIGELSLCFSGNIINRRKLVNRFKNQGHTFEKKGRDVDVELIAKIINQEKEIVKGIKRIASEVKGSYAFFILTKQGIYAARSPNAHWSLVIGQKRGATLMATESGGFSNLGFRFDQKFKPTDFASLGFKFQRNLKPGEIVLMKDGHCQTKGMVHSETTQFCSFNWVYTAFPNGIFEGISASLVRKRLSALLAQQDIADGFISSPDIVAPVPDSGRFHAIGYIQEFIRQMNQGRIKKMPFYDEVLLKYPYSSRSFIQQKQSFRDLEAFVKLLSSGERFHDPVIVICDDSIVRGTQSQTNLVPKLLALGFKEENIHFRISSPELVSHCPWGKTTRRNELLSGKIPSIKGKIEFLRIGSLKYNTIDGLVEAIGLPREKLCLDCFK